MLSATWVPIYLNADEKSQRYQWPEHILEFFRLDSNDFLSRLVTMDEKQQSGEWWYSRLHRPKKF
jgi:hypothetical protein